MKFRPFMPHRGTSWFVTLAVVGIIALGSGLLVTSVQASTTPPTFSFTADDQGANDEPGQKDLSADAAAFDGDGDYWTAWQWDDIKWSGNNTGDACSLFDTDGDGNANYAVCVTIGGDPPTELSTRVYSCTDNRADRCTGSTLLGTESSDAVADWCQVSQVGGTFDATDTRAACNITDIGEDLTLSDIDDGSFLNSCSYPSEQPNSDPSDCVHTVANVNTSVATLSSGTATWSATLNDTATMTPLTATGSVVFKLWGVNTAGTCSVLIWESASVNLVNGLASTMGAGTTSGTNVITNLTVDGDGIYYWSVDYTPTGAFNVSSSVCGEATTITPASVSGAAG